MLNIQSIQYLKLNDFGILDVNTLKYEVSVKPHDLSEALLNVTFRLNAVGDEWSLLTF